MLGLDLKLALRTLRKSWGLTLFGGAAMAVAIAVGASLFERLHVVSGTSVPLQGGDRLVVIQPYDPETRQARGSRPADFVRWRAGLDSVEEIGAFRTVERDLVTADGPAPPVSVAEISASAFRLAGVAPRLGRFLLPEDESAGAPPVVVLGHDAWQSTFIGDPDVVGRDVRLDGVYHTVVGVMPGGFAFPVNHAYWTALGTGASEDPVVVFARLADGSTLASAQAEVETLGLAEPGRTTEAGAPLRARVVPYVTGLVGERPAFVLALLPLILPLVLLPPCGNVAILVYARTVAREGELAARTALGATRARSCCSRWPASTRSRRSSSCSGGASSGFARPSGRRRDGWSRASFGGCSSRSRSASCPAARGPVARLVLRAGAVRVSGGRAAVAVGVAGGGGRVDCGRCARGRRARAAGVALGPREGFARGVRIETSRSSRPSARRRDCGPRVDSLSCKAVDRRRDA